ncbi:hypothetical protein ACHAXT_012591 [Thalassiosira profunda]
MRLPRLLFTVSIAASPSVASAGFWSSWFGRGGAQDDAPADDAPSSPGGDGGVDPLIAGWTGLVDWFRSYGGTVDERVAIGYESGTNVRGLIATAPIPADTILIHTPKSLVLSTSDGGQCASIAAIKNELSLGDQSWWSTYFAFDDSAGTRIPSQWDKSDGPGSAVAELQGLPPSGSEHRHSNWYQSACQEDGAEMTEEDWRALLLYLTRAADIGLVPIYDLMNHHTGLINTVLQRDESGGLSVVAAIDIAAGESIYNRYASSGFESTTDLWDTYGFVEEYPQLWRWSDEKLAQNPVRYGTGGLEPNSEHYEVLVISPTLAALAPTKELVQPLGNMRRSLDEWQELIVGHNANVRSAFVDDLRDSAKTMLDGLPTTIAEDEAMIRGKKRELAGEKDTNKADALQAIEYRLAFKKALELAVEVASGETFLSDPLIDGYPSFVDWFRSNGGAVDDWVTMGYEPGTTIRGMIATAPIPANTVIVHTPGSLIIASSEEGQCQSIDAAIKEMELGTRSKWHTYFEFDDSTGSRIPSQWDGSSEGQAVKELQGLPPSGETHRHIVWYESACKQNEPMTDLDWKGLLIYLTRAADIGLIPMYDLLNHHNGRINTRQRRTEDGGLEIVAATDISPGEPLYNTYARSGFESSTDVFNTYGFVEDYPQLWRWHDQELNRLSEENPNHAHQRFGRSDTVANDDPGRFEPNSQLYEVLVVSPTLVALSPSKHLVKALGNERLGPDEWQELIIAHHANLRTSHVEALRESAILLELNLPTSIDEDEALIAEEKHRLERAESFGRVDVNEADVLQAMEYRRAFKKALRLAAEIAEQGTFLADTDEL